MTTTELNLSDTLSQLDLLFDADNYEVHVGPSYFGSGRFCEIYRRDRDFELGDPALVASGLAQTTEAAIRAAIKNGGL